jgi:nucleoside-diphosphate-sugar epimerase
LNRIARIAVTGAGGFIGRAVCRALLAKRCEIRALVGPPSDLLPAPPGATLNLRAAITDRSALSELLDGGVDAVVHLAGPPSVRASFDEPLAYVEAHTAGTAALLDACRHAGVQRFVYVSSAEVYGRPLTDPVDETHPLDARSPYAAAKVGAEQMVRAYGHAYGIGATIVRPFSVYGPGMGAHALLPAILRQLGTADTLRLADLRPERDYCQVDDVAAAIIAAASVRRAGTLAVNVGTGIGTSVRDLAQHVLRLAGHHLSITEDVGARRPGNAEILRLVADRRLAAAELGWEPHISLERGLAAMLAAPLGAPS